MQSQYSLCISSYDGSDVVSNMFKAELSEPFGCEINMRCIELRKFKDIIYTTSHLQYAPRERAHPPFYSLIGNF